MGLLIVSLGAVAQAAEKGRPTANAYANSQLNPQQRIRAAARLLGKSGLRTTGRKGSAILAAHGVGAGQIGRDGVTQAGVRRDGSTNYSIPQLRAKARILRQAGFTRREIQKLFDAGIAGEAALPPDEASIASTFDTINDARSFVDHNTPIGNVDFDSLQSRRDAMAIRIRDDIRKVLAVLEGTVPGDKAMAERALSGLNQMKREVFQMDEQIFNKRQIFGR